jgi:signal transduction histidine kinase
MEPRAQLAAYVSWATVVALVPFVPQALAMHSPEEMEREIRTRRRLEGKLRQSKEVAEGANLAKSQFLANMSQEL